MPRPERRRRADLVAVAVITAVVAVAAALVWFHSPERATRSVPAVAPAPAPDASAQPPGRLAEAWRAPDGAASAPMAVGGTVITADGSAVQGRDFRSGEVRWSYARDIPLCATAAAFDAAIAVYRTGDGCSEVTAIEADSGRRGPQRSGNADDTLRLIASPDDSSVVAAGPTRIEAWRSDLVRTVEYGRVDAPVIPDGQPRSGCTMESAAASGTRIAVIERCPDDPGVRLSVLTTTPEDPATPDVLGSQVIGADGRPIQSARVVAVSGDRTAVIAPAVPGGPRLFVYDATAAGIASEPLPGLVADDLTAPEDFVVADRTGPVITLWTGPGPGAGTVALDAGTLTVRWRMPDALGPATRMGPELLVPVPAGLAVTDPGDGTVLRTLDVDRGDYRGAVVPAAIGYAVLEQRGDELVALRPPA